MLADLSLHLYLTSELILLNVKIVFRCRLVIPKKFKKGSIIEKQGIRVNKRMELWP